MKKKWIALLLSLVMAVSAGLPAFADTAPLTLSSANVGIKVGESTSLTAFSGGSQITNATWSSDSPGVASVSGGTVTGVTLGRATVTAKTSDGRSASCVVHVAKKGIDVSYYQGNISWADVKNSGIDFAIIRAGYGSKLIDSQTDTNFGANYDGATANGIKAGAYWMSYATTTDEAVDEAQMCLSVINGRHLDYPVFIDIEQASQKTLPKDQLTAIAAAFCKAITDTGYKAGIYSPTSIFNSNLGGPSLDSYDKWPAHWGVNAADYSSPYAMWQYGTGTVPGITSGVVDMDYSYRDYPNPVPTPEDTSILSDTGSVLTMQKGKSYTFKFTPNGTSAVPSFTTGNSGVIKSASVQKIGGSYYYKITAAGSGCTAVYSTLPGQQPVRRCVVTVA